jgi:8-oxo-dGTP pyrophosphatase MutT (NUDIX family)
MNIPPCFYRLSVKALILDENNKFLLAKEPDGKWDLPGGGLEYKEDINLAITREIKEELGLEVVYVAPKPSYFTTFLKKGTDVWMANVIYLTKVKNLDFKPSDECVEIKFFSTQEATGLDNYGGITELTRNIWLIKQ